MVSVLTVIIFMELGILYKGFISYNPSLQISFLSITIANIYSECVNVVHLHFNLLKPAGYVINHHV